MASPQIENGYIKVSNELYDALIKTRINGEARQMLDAIIRKTYGFSKKEDAISTSQFMQMTGMSKNAVNRARSKLVEMNIITVSQKGYPVTQKGYRQILTYSIQKDYEKWKRYPKKDTVSQKESNCIPKRVQRVSQNVSNNKQYKRNTKDNTPFVDFEKSTVMKWNDLCNTYPNIPKINTISNTRRNKLKSRYTEPDFKNFEKIVKAVGEQKFLHGSNGKWRISFDWIIANDTNYVKVLERRYADQGQEETALDDIRRKAGLIK